MGYQYTHDSFPYVPLHTAQQGDPTFTGKGMEPERDGYDGDTANFIMAPVTKYAAIDVAS